MGLQARIAEAASASHYANMAQHKPCSPFLFSGITMAGHAKGKVLR